MKEFKVYWYEPGKWVVEWGKRKYYAHDIILTIPCGTINSKTNPHGSIRGEANKLYRLPHKNNKTLIVISNK
jgi:hypothetical protein